MKVRATQLGFYGTIRRYEGDEFTITDGAHFSSRWMEKLDGEEEQPRRGRKPKAEEVQPEA